MLLISITAVSAVDVVMPTDATTIRNAVDLVGLGSDAENTITLESITYDTDNTAIALNKNIVFEGNGATLDAKGAGLFFTVNSGVNVTFKNIIFENGVGGQGGAIKNYGFITVIGCTFINNTVNGVGSGSGNSGGAIHNSGTMFIDDCTFIGNKAGVSAGAVYNEVGNNSIIQNSRFYNNTGGHGGAIDIVEGNNILITGCEFIDNFADVTNGGAIYIHTMNDVNGTRIIGSTFENNRATTNGGAIYNLGNNTFVDGSEFTNNTALNGNGGAIENRGTMAADNSIFVNNTASVFGGAISNVGSMEVSRNSMSGNAANNGTSGVVQGAGQMIYNSGTMGVLVLTFIDNQTYYVYDGQLFPLYAKLTDDRGNTVTWQGVSFNVNGNPYGPLNSVEGVIEFIDYTVAGSPGQTIPVTGDYAGHGSFLITRSFDELDSHGDEEDYEIHIDGYRIDIRPGLLRIIANSTAKVTIDWNKDEYFVGETGNCLVTVTNTGNFDDIGTKVVITLPDGFVLDPSTIDALKGTYDPATNTWTIGDLAPGATVTLKFSGKFTKTGTYPVTANLTGTNFEPSNDDDTAIVREPETGTEDDDPIISTDDPDVSKPDPDTPNIDNDNNNNNVSDDITVSAAMKKTGVPILAILLLLLSIIGTCVYRKK